LENTWQTSPDACGGGESDSRVQVSVVALGVFGVSAIAVLVMSLMGSASWWIPAIPLAGSLAWLAIVMIF